MGKTQKIITTWLWALIVISMLALVATQSMRGQASRAGSEESQALFTVPAFELIDQNGSKLSNKDLLGKVWIADFVFTNCAGPCPRMTHTLADVQGKLSSADVKLVSFSVDPERDTPAVLKEYAKNNAADESRWSFLTGTTDQMQAVARGMNMTADKQLDQSILHSTQFLLVDQTGGVRGIYRLSDDDTVQHLVEDAMKLAAR